MFIHIPPYFLHYVHSIQVHLFHFLTFPYFYLLNLFVCLPIKFNDPTVCTIKTSAFSLLLNHGIYPLADPLPSVRQLVANQVNQCVPTPPSTLEPNYAELAVVGVYHFLLKSARTFKQLYACRSP